MALVTYILLSTLIAGLRGQFQIELLGLTATTSLVVVICEIFLLKLGCYLLSISSQSQLFDLIAYSGYKFVGIITTIVVAQIFNGGKGTGGWVGWAIFVYTFLANSLFLVCSLSNHQDCLVPEADFFIADRCARSNMSCCRKMSEPGVARCRQIRGPSAAKGRSSFSSILILCSCSSCGSCRGNETGTFVCLFQG